ncbi:hypothetical protein JRQ81_017652 [Phrynocephalus forsythii]|uniref:Uncharacterized protein n=1 Tax=Phrynocephalus forsythii TaxID=171643 RepID=A0A9Q0XRR5_9SAUR|nr:hypothetical protein JRQ81_017652 [Phrynocephalus forsythii]
MSSSERDPPSPTFVSPLKQDVHMTGDYATLHECTNPENVDFATGIAETYFSTEYWKSNLSSGSIHLKEEHERENNESVCCMAPKMLEDDTTLLKEDRKTIPANLLSQKAQDIRIKSPISVHSAVTSVSLANISSACCTHDFHSTPAIQDSDISNLINEVSLTNASDMGGSVSALIEDVDVPRDQSDLTVVSNSLGISKQLINTKSVPPPCVLPYDQNKMFDYESSCRPTIESAICSTPEITMLLSPEKTECSVSPSSHNKSMNNLAYTRQAIEDTSTLSSSIPPATVLKANPKRKCRTNWESLSENNSGFSDTSDVEHTVFVPFTCTNSTGSSLVEVGGEFQDLLITAYEYKREDMSQLASPLKLKLDQDTLYYKAVCEDQNNVNLHNTMRAENIKFRSDKEQYLSIPRTPKH